MPQGIAILGSTGSIGRNALRVIEALGPEYRVIGLSAHRNMELLAQQALRYQPHFVAITNRDSVAKFRAIMDGQVKILSGPDCLTGLVQSDEVDTILAAVVGAAGLAPVMAAAEAGKRLAVANKEPLVIAGELLTRAVAAHGSTLLPVDSEHSAVFQALQAGGVGAKGPPNAEFCVGDPTDHSPVQRILLTGSGGPFRGATRRQLEEATLEQALSHPTWRMGPKITIDSATMMNKALEIIEARWLFDMPVEKIEVLIHPESIVHSLVEFVDGSVIAQLGQPDMCLPIQYALTYPRRVTGISRPLRLEEIGELHFEKPDPHVFHALPLAYEVARAGGTAAAVFNAANEAAVAEFLAGRLKFLQIMELVEHCLNKHEIRHITCLEELLEADAWARREVRDRLLVGR
jgi:1-deoxy-D-xylulose-5-phosphate reductoisomerase